MDVQAGRDRTPEEWVALNESLAATKAALAKMTKERDTLKEDLDRVKKELGIASEVRTELEAEFANQKCNAVTSFDRSIILSWPNSAWGTVYRGFNTIPDEVLGRILGHVHISDVVSVARTCRRFHACVGPVIPVILQRSVIDMVDLGKHLQLISRQGKVDGIKGLIAAGANVNQAATDGRTPRVVAARHGHVEVIKILDAARTNVSHGNADK